MSYKMCLGSGEYVVNTTTNSNNELVLYVRRVLTNNLVLVAVGTNNGVLIRGVYACSQTDITRINRMLAWLMV